MTKAVPALQPTKKQRYSIHPRNGWVLVRKLTLDEEVTEAGLIVDKSQARTLKAEVVESSLMLRNGEYVPSDLKAGDTVLVNAMTLEMEDLEEMTGDKKLVMIRDEEIYSRCVPLED